MHIQLDLDPAGPLLQPLQAAMRRAGAQLDRERPQALNDTARRHHAAVLRRHMPDAIRDRIAVVPELAALLDARWPLDDTQRVLLCGALAHFATADDLIPDDGPLGLLDDALAIDLALDACREPWRAWRRARAGGAAQGRSAGYLPSRQAPLRIG